MAAVNSSMITSQSVKERTANWAIAVNCRRQEWSIIRILCIEYNVYPAMSASQHQLPDQTAPHGTFVVG